MDLAHKIDHTLLKPDCTLGDVKKICQEAVSHTFKAVCLPPFYVKDAVQFLDNTPVKTATVIGFPMGYAALPAKVEEIKRAADEGVDELDVVINLCAVRNRNWNYVKNELESVITACHMRGKLVKAIIETGILSKEELLKICEICADSEVDYVKTSTGFNGPGASVEIVELLRKTLPANIKIKASGGIRDRAFAEALIRSGADRLGCSASIQILQG